MNVLGWFFTTIGAVVTTLTLLGLMSILIGCACDAIAIRIRDKRHLFLTQWEKNAMASAVGICRQAAEDTRSNGPDFDGVEHDQVATTLEAILARSK
jgi:hypothetical protein